jgi:hypothetical protein
VGYSTHIFDVWRKGVWVFGLYGRAYAALLLVGVVAYLTLLEKGDPILPRLARWLRRPDGQVRWAWITVLALVPLLLLAFSLRLAFAQNSSLYIDEYTSLLAARYTVDYGVPRTPSGAYYTRGVLFTYLQAAVSALGPFDKVLARLPTVLLGSATVLAAFVVGRRMFNATTALLAAVWLAFAPEAITWGGRARMYALLQLLVLLAVYFFYKGVVETRRDGARHLFVLFFLAALFTQMEAALLLPAFGLAWLLWQKPRDWLRPAVWLDVGLLAAGMVVRLYLHGLMVPPGLPGPAVPRPFVAPGGDLWGGLVKLAPFFASPDRWLVTSLFVVGMAGLVVTLVRRRWPYLREERPAITFVYFLVTVVLLEVMLVVGDTWRHPRYLFLILPWFFLAAAAVADGGLRWVWTWCQRRWPILRANRIARLGPVVFMILLVLGVSSVLAPQAIATSRSEDTGYDLAFEFVQQEWQPGDAVATTAPAACLLFLDRCEYLAIELGYEGYSLESEGRKVESFANLPILESGADLEAALADHSRLWFVVDTERLERYFSPEFVSQVWDQMGLVASERGVLVFRSGPDLFSAAVQQANDVDFDGQVRLVGTDLEAGQVEPGETLRLAFRWQAQSPLAEDYAVMVHVDDASGQTMAVADSSAVSGLYPMYYWPPGEVIVDRREVTIPPDTPPGRYRLNTALYDPETGERLPVGTGGDPHTDQATAAFFWVGEPPSVQAPTHTREASFEDQICLQGYDLETASGGTSVMPGETVALTLHWEACGPVVEDYHTFVHLIGPDGQTVSQSDAPPIQGQYPTTFWQQGERLADRYQVEIPADTPSGEYLLRVGLYVLANGERLTVESGDDGISLTSLQVGP